MPNNGTVLCDTGPLIALFRAGDRAQEECEQALRALDGPGVTTVPVLTEAFYFLDRFDEQQLLWEYLLQGSFRIIELVFRDLERMRDLMAKYADLPMDFADASLVAVGERLKVRRVFTLDRHFRVYRPRHTSSFELLP